MTSLAISSQRNDGSDHFVYIKEFRSHDEGNDNGNDIDIDAFNSVLLHDDDENQHDSIQTISKECSLRHQFLLQAALESMNQEIVFENRLRKSFSRSFQGADYMWIGIICTLDEYRFYGYITNTNVKIVVSVKDDIFPEQIAAQQSRDGAIKKILVS